MKIKIIDVKAITNANVNIKFELYDDGDKLVLTDTRGFVNLEKVEADVVAAVTQSFKNIASTFTQQSESKLNESMVKLIGQEINLN